MSNSWGDISIPVKFAKILKDLVDEERAKHEDDEFRRENFACFSLALKVIIERGRGKILVHSPDMIEMS
jgi:hypothetical protein